MIPRVENRTHRRMNLELPVCVSAVSNFFNYLFQAPKLPCITRDVSMKGIRVLAVQPFPVGSAVDVWVKLPDDPTGVAFKLRGRVRWSSATQGEGRDFFAGIQLDDRQGHSLALWTNAIRERICEHFKAELSAGTVSGSPINAG